MVRFFVSTLIQLAAAAVGFIVAAALLDGMDLKGAAFIVAVAIFTLCVAILSPFFLKMAMKKAQALMGATALVTTFVSLLITHWVSDGLSISGADTWLFATLIVWVVTLLAAWIIPVILVKRGVESARARNSN